MINYDVPRYFDADSIRPRDEYVHRIGRTGRVGNAGKATTLFDYNEDASFAPELVAVLSEVFSRKQWTFLGGASCARLAAGSRNQPAWHVHECCRPRRG